MSDVADKVRKAADYIEKHGLHKGNAFDGSKVTVQWDDTKPWGEQVIEAGAKCCTLGAIWAHFDDGEPDGLHNFVIERSPGPRYTSVPQWNDAPERTAEEVVSTLRAFADHLDQKESSDE